MYFSKLRTEFIYFFVSSIYFHVKNKVYNNSHKIIKNLRQRHLKIQNKKNLKYIHDTFLKKNTPLRHLWIKLLPIYIKISAVQ